MKIQDNIKRLSVNKIFKNPWNPNRMSDALFLKERNSIKKFGFIVPLVVRKVDNGFELIDGEHRLQAAIAEGYSELPVNDLGKVTDEVAKQLTLILNMHGEARRDKLADLLADLEKTVNIDELIENLPMSDSEIKNMLHVETIDWANLSAEAASPRGAMVAGDDSPAPVGSIDPRANESSQGDQKTIAVTVTTDEYRLFFEQIDRINRMLVPEAEPSKCAPAPALNVMAEIIGLTDLGAFFKNRKRIKKPKSVVRKTKK